MENKKQSVELADIFSKYGTAFLKNHSLCNEQSKAFEAITICRTSNLGGHAHMCDHCGYTRYSPEFDISNVLKKNDLTACRNCFVLYTWFFG